MVNRTLSSLIRLSLVGILGMAAPAQALADAMDAFEFFQEEAKVVTAARRPQAVHDSPLSIEVITAEDIKASGVVNIWDLMRYRAGITVLDGRSVDGNRAVVSVRGFPDEYVRNLQVLVDGRSVYQPINGGVYWEQLPVQIQDIDRIEIVRGPNAALYGSNAGLGVINIITKKPVEKTSLSVTGMGGNLGMHSSAEAVESAVRDFHYRLSHTYRENGGYPLASTGAEGTDFVHSNKLDFRGSWDSPDKATTWDVSGGNAWDTTGATGGGNQAAVRQDYEMVKWSHATAADAAVEATVARNDFMRELGPRFTGIEDTHYSQYDNEALYRFGWWDRRMYTTSGLRYRHVGLESEALFPGQDILMSDLYSGFLQQNIQVMDKLSLLGAVSLENSTTGGTQPAYQVATLYRITPEHGLRFAYSLAPTLPPFFDSNTNLRPNFALQIIGNRNAVPQKLRSYEVGYRGQFRHLETEATLFYMTTHNQEASILSGTRPPFTTTFLYHDASIARGAELAATYRFKQGRSVYANYTFENITDIDRVRTIQEGTPTHMVNVGAMTPLGRGFSFSANMGYKDAYFVNSASRGTSVAAPAHTRVDARLGYTPPAYSNLEFFMSCQNMTQSDHVEFADGLTIPRTYQGGVSLKFGGKE